MSRFTVDTDPTLRAEVYCDCDRIIQFRPSPDLTVTQMIQATGYALEGCPCAVEKRHAQIRETHRG